MAYCWFGQSQQLRVRVVPVNQVTAELSGFRLLVERHWPDGAQKKDLVLDAWLKEVAPSPGLMAWFDHSPAQWDRFCDRYARELESKPQELDVLLAFVRKGPVLLICDSGHEPFNSAVALKQFIRSKCGLVDRGERPYPLNNQEDSNEFSLHGDCSTGRLVHHGIVDRLEL